ncbi:MAG: hypothetical protein ACTHM6_00010 [Tepidisphaeraceae bacterium]
MAFQRWRWWQWMAVAIVVGGLLGFVFNMQDVDDASIQSVSPGQFIRKLQFRTDQGKPIVTDIRVSPAMKDAAGHVVNAVTFWELQKKKTTGTWEPVREWRFYAGVPFYTRAPRPDYSILDFLAEKKKDIPALDYSTRWWQVPRTMYLLCIGGSVLVIGVLWPMLLRALVRAGLGAPEEVDAGIDLSRVSSSSEDIPIPTRAAVSEEDRGKLDALNAALESNVAGMTIGDSKPAEPASAAEVAKQEQAIRELPNAPLEHAPAAAAPKPTDDDYKGEYYPVARPAGKRE